MQTKTKLFSFLLALVLLISFEPLLADAAPSFTTPAYTVYIGENDYLYIIDNATGSSRVLPTAVNDILSVTDTSVYCLANGGSLYNVYLDGSGSSSIAVMPTQEQLDEYSVKPSFRISDEGELFYITPEGEISIASRFVINAVHDQDTLYYAELTQAGIVFMAYPLNALTGSASVPPVAREIGPALMMPVSLFASDNNLIALDGKGNAVIYNLETLTARLVILPEDTVSVVIINDIIISYRMDPDTGSFHYSKSMDSAMPTPTPAPTATPAATPYITPPPTAAPPSDVGVGYTPVKFGQNGSLVRNMQNRLRRLGYPLTSVDGVFGQNTLRCLHLFQEQSGYTESNTASANLLDLMYSSRASRFNLHKARRTGQRGERVVMLQERLIELFYTQVGQPDGIYGSKTAAAVSAFQKSAGLKVTGNADTDTMKALYASNAPANPTATPTPTSGPTQAPTPTPTGAPTGGPTDDPSTTPTETPTATPTEEPTATPTINIWPLKLGDIGDEVKSLNNALIKLTLLSNDFINTTTFSAETKIAVEAYQTSVSPSNVTGQVLKDLYDEILIEANKV